MRIISVLVVVISLCGLVSACSQSLKAPCDQYAYFCGFKTKINQW